MLRGEVLDDLRAAAMAVEVAEAADVHENVEAQRGAGMKGAERFVVPAAVLQAELDDFGVRAAGRPATRVAELAVGVAADGIKERRGELDFERFGALDEIDERGRGAEAGL